MSASGQKATSARYSITSSAIASSLSGIITPSAFAVFRLITKSNSFGCSTGMSPGFAPRKILSTVPAARLDPTRPERTLRCAKVLRKEPYFAGCGPGFE